MSNRMKVMLEKKCKRNTMRYFQRILEEKIEIKYKKSENME